jgi:hypothetical protein
MSQLLDSTPARKDVRLDITDLYVFRGETGTVFVLDVNSSVSGEEEPKGFHPSGQYEFKVDVDGDAVEDLTYRLTFGERESAGRQPLELRRLVDLEAGDHGAAGRLVARGTTDAIIAGDGGLQLWAGLAEEPCYLEPTVLAAVRNAVKHGTNVDLSGWQPAGAINALAGTFVHSIVLEVADGDLEEFVRRDRRIGVWATTAVPGEAPGTWRQVNRMGLPMMQSIFNYGGQRADEYSTAQPADDPANYGAVVAALVTGVVRAQGTADDPAAYGETLAELFLPDVLPYQVGTSANYGFAALNGRALADNAPEVMFSLVTNSALSHGLTRHDATGRPADRFPYVSLAVREKERITG